jgi:hypothetical protein
MSPEDLILVTRFVGEATIKPDGADYSSYDKARSDESYGTLKQNLRDMAKMVVSKKASQGKPLATAIAEKFASEVVDELASDVTECVGKGLSDAATYQSVYAKYASKCSDAFLRGAVRRVYAAAVPGRPGAFDYKTVYVDTEKGLKDAERLQREGWKIIRSGLHMIQFERPKDGKSVEAAQVGRWTTSNTELKEWSERDRNSVVLEDKASGNSIMEWWDEAVEEAVTDGFLTMNKGKDRLHQSAVDYANEHQLKPKPSDFWHKAFQDAEKFRSEDKDAANKGNIGLPRQENYDDFDQYFEDLKIWLGVDDLSPARKSEEKIRWDKVKKDK